VSLNSFVLEQATLVSKWNFDNLTVIEMVTGGFSRHQSETLKRFPNRMQMVAKNHDGIERERVAHPYRAKGLPQQIDLLR
jgi:hypothetical protein